MKHLVLISTSYPLSRDGSEAAGTFVADFAEALSQKIQVTVIAPAPNEYIEQIHPTLTVHYFAVPKLPLSSLRPYQPHDWPMIWHTLQAGAKSLNRVIDASLVDHVLALWVLPSGYWAKQIAGARGIPYSTWALGSDIWTLGKIPLVRGLLKRVLQSAQYNFADGYQLKQDVEALSGKPCAFLPSTRNIPVPENKHLATKPPYRLAFLGRWHPNKGVDILLESLALLEEADWARITEVRIAGGGPLEQQVHQAHDRLRRVGRPVTLLGYLQKQQAAELFAWADYVLIPSRIESIPVVFSDAMKCRCPVVAMPVGDLPRLINDYQVGFFASTPSAKAYAEVIKMALTTPPEQFLSGLSQAQKAFNVEQSAKTWFLKTTT